MKTIVVAIVIAIGSIAARSEEDFGGELKVWPKDHGTFLFVNAQDAISANVVAKPVEQLAKRMNYDIQLKNGSPVDIRTVPVALKALGAKGAVWIVNDPALPLVLAACENDWAILNVAPVLSDNPDAAKIDARLIRIVNRLFAYIHGVGEPTAMPQCVLKPAIGMEGIDKLVCRTYSPDTYSKVVCYMNSLGYRTCKRGTYYDACEEGWAPLPTNAVQKAIWDKVHAMPTKPLQIKPETKKVSE